MYTLTKPVDKVEVPTLHIDIFEWQRMMAYVQACPVEINGFGLATWRDRKINIDHIFILDQEATAGSVETDEAALSAYQLEMHRAGDSPTRIRFQWHSHVRGSAYFSGTDTDNIERWPGDWLVSLVTNHQGDYECRLDIFTPLRVTVPMQVRVSAPFPRMMREAIVQEVQQHVRQPRRIFGSRPAPVIVTTTSSEEYEPAVLEVG